MDGPALSKKSRSATLRKWIPTDSRLANPPSPEVVAAKLAIVTVKSAVIAKSCRCYRSFPKAACGRNQMAVLEGRAPSRPLAPAHTATTERGPPGHLKTCAPNGQKLRR